MSVLLGNDLTWSHQWESEVLTQILVGVISLDLRVADDRSLDDLDVASHSSMSPSHVIVHLTDGTSEGDIPVFLVHIVSTTSASVAQPDGEVLDLSRVFIEDLSNIKHFTASWLSLSERLHIVPELGLSDDLIAGEYLHSVDLRAWVLRSRGGTTNELVQVHLDKRMENTCLLNIPSFRGKQSRGFS
jgi:hypothetical protein